MTVEPTTYHAGSLVVTVAPGKSHSAAWAAMRAAAEADSPSTRKAF